MDFNETWSKNKGWFVVGATSLLLVGVGGFVGSFGNLTQSLLKEFECSEALTGKYCVFCLSIKHLESICVMQSFYVQFSFMIKQNLNFEIDKNYLLFLKSKLVIDCNCFRLCRFFYFWTRLWLKSCKFYYYEEDWSSLYLSHWYYTLSNWHDIKFFCHQYLSFPVHL